MKGVVSGGDNHETRRDANGRSAQWARPRPSACSGHQPARATRRGGQRQLLSKAAGEPEDAGPEGSYRSLHLPRAGGLSVGEVSAGRRSCRRELSPGQATAPARASALALTDVASQATAVLSNALCWLCNYLIVFQMYLLLRIFLTLYFLNTITFS